MCYYFIWVYGVGGHAVLVTWQQLITKMHYEVSPDIIHKFHEFCTYIKLKRLVKLQISGTYINDYFMCSCT